MTDFVTPRGFVRAVADIKAYGGVTRLLFVPKEYRCLAWSTSRRRPAGTVEVGWYAPEVLGRNLARKMRADLKLAVEAADVPRGTRRAPRESTTYEKITGTAGRRSV